MLSEKQINEEKSRIADKRQVVIVFIFRINTH